MCLAKLEYAKHSLVVHNTHLFCLNGNLSKLTDMFPYYLHELIEK